MSPLASCRLFCLEPSLAVLFGVRAAELPDESGVAAALALVRALRAGRGLLAHAGVHAGPVIERDLDLFGRTVNLASRIAGAAGPGEVLVSEAVVEMAKDPAARVEPVDRRALKGGGAGRALPSTGRREERDGET